MTFEALLGLQIILLCSYGAVVEPDAQPVDVLEAAPLDIVPEGDIEPEKQREGWKVEKNAPSGNHQAPPEWLEKRKLGLEIPVDVWNQTSANKVLRLMNWHGLVVIRNQTLTRKQQVDITQLLGKPLVLPPSFRGDDLDEDFPEIRRITNFWEGGEPKVEDDTFGRYWHAEGHHYRNMGKWIYTLLYVDEFTFENGGGVSFLDTRCELEAVNSEPHRQTGQHLKNHRMDVRARHVKDFANAKAEDYAEFPLAHHPMVFSHPFHARIHYYLGDSDVTVWNGFEEKDLSKSASRRLIKDTLDLIKPSLYKHQLEKGDLLIWDNLQVMHKQMKYENDGISRRMLYRTQAGASPRGLKRAHRPVRDEESAPEVAAIDAGSDESESEAEIEAETEAEVEAEHSEL